MKVVDANFAADGTGTAVENHGEGSTSTTSVTADGRITVVTVNDGSSTMSTITKTYYPSHYFTSVTESSDVYGPTRMTYTRDATGSATRTWEHYDANGQFITTTYSSQESGTFDWPKSPATSNSDGIKLNGEVVPHMVSWHLLADEVHSGWQVLNIDMYGGTHLQTGLNDLMVEYDGDVRATTDNDVLLFDSIRAILHNYKPDGSFEEMSYVGGEHGTLMIVNAYGVDGGGEGMQFAPDGALIVHWQSQADGRSYGAYFDPYEAYINTEVGNANGYYQGWYMYADGSTSTYEFFV